MTAAEILALIAAGGQAITTIMNLIEKARATLAEPDAEVEAALAAMQAQNDAAFTRLDAKLAVASGDAPAG
jgi:hypothetical protein